MADRLKFKFTFSGQIHRAGEVYVDVLDPSDVEEIKQKLTSQDWSRFLILEEVIDAGKMTFTPSDDSLDD